MYQHNYLNKREVIRHSKYEDEQSLSNATVAPI